MSRQRLYATALAGALLMAAGLAAAGGVEVPEDIQAVLRTVKTQAAASQESLTARERAHIEQEQRALEQGIRNVFPMTRGGQKRLLEEIDDRQEGLYQHIPKAKPLNQTISLRLRAGEEIPRLKVALNRVTTLVFADITGSPWPVTAARPSSDAVLGIERPENHPHVVIIWPKVYGGHANLVVLLQDEAMPINIELAHDTEEYNGLTPMQVAKRGPKSALPPGLAGGPGGLGGGQGNPAGLDAFDPDLLATLDGLGPTNGRRLKIEGSDRLEVWQKNRELYIRTELTLNSPAPLGERRGLNGLKAYRVPLAPVLRVSHEGRQIRVGLVDLSEHAAN